MVGDSCGSIFWFTREVPVLSSVIDFGIPGLRVDQGDHICAFYQSPAERNDVLIPFLRAGLSAGDKCVCIVDVGDLDTVAGDLGADLGEERAQVEHQLVQKLCHAGEFTHAAAPRECVVADAAQRDFIGGPAQFWAEPETEEGFARLVKFTQ